MDRGTGGIDRRGTAAGDPGAAGRQGPGALRSVSGDYVLAYVSGDEATVTLFRPAHSCVPLFWCRREGRVHWATDPWNSCPGPGPPRPRGHRDGAHAHRPVGDPGRPVVVAGIHRLPPGCALELAPSGRPPTVRPYDRLVPGTTCPGPRPGRGLPARPPGHRHHTDDGGRTLGRGHAQRRTGLRGGGPRDGAARGPARRNPLHPERISRLRQ
ncbi:hypothetical protein NKH77_48550 [Streptomyces sp. M19]